LSAGTWTPQGQFMQQLPPQLDDLRYHHHPQYTSSAPYHQPTAATGESRIGFKMFSSANEGATLHGVLLSAGWELQKRQDFWVLCSNSITCYTVSRQAIK